MGVPGTEFDTIVVGAGAAGSAVACFLARRGQRVLLFEQFELNHVRGSSHGRTRILRTAYSEGSEYVPLVRRARALWLELGEETGRELFRPIGALILGRPDSRVVSRALATARAVRAPHEVLSADAVRSRFPAFAPDDSEVAILDREAGALFPERCIETFVELARNSGAHVRFGEAVKNWRSDRSKVRVNTDRATFSGRALVLAVGSWLPAVVSDLGVPFEIERQAVFWFGPRRDEATFGPDRMPAFVWQRRAQGYFYGLPNFGDGVKVASDEGTVVESPDRVDRAIADADRTPVRKFVERRIPGADGPELDATTCIYTNTPDRRFLLDIHPSFPNVWIASACSGHGFKFASAVGETLADWIVDGRPGIDLSSFRYDLARRAAPTPLPREP
jgi:sarcosine oxidase